MKQMVRVWKRERALYSQTQKREKGVHVTIRTDIRSLPPFMNRLPVYYTIA